MTPEYNLAPIKIGDTYSVKFAYYEDECEEVTIDVSSYIFLLQAKNSAGTVVLEWDNTDFAETELWERTVTMTNTATSSLTAGEYRYELQVNTGSGVYTYMQGYVKIVDQITS